MSSRTCGGMRARRSSAVIVLIWRSPAVAGARTAGAACAFGGELHQPLRRRGSATASWIARP